MAAAGLIRYAYLAHLSRPKSIRRLYRLVKRRRVCRIVEVGISDISRTVAMIEVAQRYAGRQKVAYTGIDWFDTRAPQLEPLSLKEAYRLLRPTESNVRLVPGEPGRSLVSAANAHQNTDLILIAQTVADAELASAWFYMPRMLHERSVILREQRDPDGEPDFVPLTIAQVSELAARDAGRRAA
ncbi:MAG: hypothetical protein WD738_12605 [Pirellulales bacterium]